MGHDCKNSGCDNYVAHDCVDICTECYDKKYGKEAKTNNLTDVTNEEDTCSVDGCSKSIPQSSSEDICWTCYKEDMFDTGRKNNVLDSTEILDDAARAVYDRADTHGAEDNFETIARFWTDYLGVEVTPTDVPNMMIMLKVARNKDGVYSDDNWADIAGYAESGSRLSE